MSDTNNKVNTENSNKLKNYFQNINLTQRITMAVTIFLIVLWSVLHNPFSGYTSKIVQGKNAYIFDTITVSNDAELLWINQPGEYWKFIIGSLILGISIFFIFSNKKKSSEND